MDAERRPPGLERARQDLAAGRRWKARDRLQGLVRARPADPEVLDLLGQVLFDMGDLPAAGRVWYLTERDDAASRQARTAFQQRWGDDTSRARQLPLYAPLDAYPPVVQARVAPLGALLPARRAHPAGISEPMPRGRAVVLGVLTVTLTVGVWLVGVLALVTLAVRCAT